MSERPRGRPLPLPCLALVTDRARRRDRPLEQIVSQAVDGGVNLVQVREKDLGGGDLYEFALRLREALQGRALLLVNERVDVALACGADGVHLPERGLPAAVARRQVGEGLLIGRSVHSVEGAAQAERDGADFVQVGTIFATGSKPGVEPAGLGLVSAVRSAVTSPVIAIGGINAGNAADVMRAGADGVAVISALMDAEDPAAAARDLWQAVTEAWAGRTAGTRA
jgi:thiamine-phosphate pyrophosphorylase